MRSPARVSLHQPGEAGRGAGQDRRRTGEPLPRSRPHGVLIARVASAGGGALQTLSGESIAVGGRIAVFGERPGTARETPAERAVRSPYLAACVLGRAGPDEPATVLSAFLHPCVSERHLMLVDSDFERQTFVQLRSVQTWLGRQNLARLSLEKPLFDVWPKDQRSAQADPRPPCLPDFIVRSRGESDAVKAVVIETMGLPTRSIVRARCAAMRCCLSRWLGLP